MERVCLKGGGIMFLGEYQHAIDAKGRLIIPAKFRDALAEGFVMTKGLDGCLFVYPIDAWHELEEKLRKLPLSHKDARAFSRFFFAGASDGEMDKQGRVMIPNNLREYGAIEKDVIVVGMSDRMEIWDLARWNAYNDDDGQTFEQLAELMGQYNVNI